MTIYETDKLVTEARKLAADYRRATGKPLGISSEIAEFDAARLMDLELLKDRPGGYDAVGKSGEYKDKRVQIKGRAIFDSEKSGQRVGHLKTDKDWDSIMLVIMNEDYEPIEIYECDREVVENALDEQKSSSRNKRGAISLAKFKIISKCVWAANGADPINAQSDADE
jgi:spore coat polysaccharide biosynthesis protein SpsF (cytidylyltransferase family)